MYIYTFKDDETNDTIVAIQFMLRMTNEEGTIRHQTFRAEHSLHKIDKPDGITIGAVVEMMMPELLTHLGKAIEQKRGYYVSIDGKTGKHTRTPFDFTSWEIE